MLAKISHALSPAATVTWVGCPKFRGKCCGRSSFCQCPLKQLFSTSTFMVNRVSRTMNRQQYCLTVRLVLLLVTFTTKLNSRNDFNKQILIEFSHLKNILEIFLTLTYLSDTRNSYRKHCHLMVLQYALVVYFDSYAYPLIVTRVNMEGNVLATFQIDGQSRWVARSSVFHVHKSAWSK